MAKLADGGGVPAAQEPLAIENGGYVVGRQSFATPNLRGTTVEELRREMQSQLNQVYARIDEAVGNRGTPKYRSDIEMNSNRIKSLGLPTDDTDAQRVDLCLHSSKPGGEYDAGNRTIINVKTAVRPMQAVNLQQLRTLLDTLGKSLRDEPFVVAAASANLTSERVLTAEAGVTLITDNGAGSTIVVSLVANGVSNAKLRQGAATSVIGRSANSVGNVADIAATADTDVLRRAGGVLGFGTIDTSYLSDAVSGTYTPTLTNVANLDGSTAFECQYMRVGSVVTVSGKVSIDPTTTATLTQLGISLPIASNLGAQEDCAGVAFASGIAGEGAAIRGDAANNRAELAYICVDVTDQPFYFTFSYEII